MKQTKCDDSQLSISSILHVTESGFLQKVFFPHPKALEGKNGLFCQTWKRKMNLSNPHASMYHCQ